MFPTRDVKACYACASAKRRCTKRLPRCQRCETRKLNCVYETRPRFIIYQDQPQGLEQPYPATDDRCFTENNDYPDGSSECYDNGTALMPAAPYMYDYMNWWPRPIGPVDASLNDLESAWFLTPETWNIVPLNADALAPVNIAVLHGYLSKAQSWLREWASTGSNPFIHSELYSKSMPACVQDAYMVLSMYLSKTDKNRDLVLRLMQDKAEAFVSLEQAKTPDNLVDQIGRVHALLVYTIMRLFDGDIRQRHLAEKHLPTLVSWAEALRERATNATGANSLLLDNPLTHDKGANGLPEGKYPKSAEGILWNAWILSESIRRTWYISRLVSSGYHLMKTGAVVCPGTIPITTRKGVWQSKTASSWLKACAEKSVGFANRNETEALIGVGKAEEVDKFTLALMELDFGTDRIEEWKRT